jgi:hypothetical protein
MARTRQPRTIGSIDVERLKLIPTEHWQAHEFCFFLHDQLAHLLVEYDKSGAQNAVLNAVRDATKGREKEFVDVNIITFLKQYDLKEEYRQHIVSHVVLALTADMLHFLYEALICFEKRKFSPGFALLRKPLKEHLIYLSWLLADEDDFVKRFERDNYKTLENRQVGKDKTIEIYRKAIAKLAVSEAFDPELIWEVIYSKNCANGFEPILQRATHLITSMGSLLKTEDYSFNFIFDSPFEDHYYKFLYTKLPYALLFITQVTLEAFNRVSAVNERTFGHLLIVTMGTYEALLKGGRQNISRMLSKQFKTFLKCTNCDKPLKVTKGNAPRLLIREEIECTACGELSQFPLYWLCSAANVVIRRDALGRAGST